MPSLKCKNCDNTSFGKISILECTKCGTIFCSICQDKTKYGEWPCPKCGAANGATYRYIKKLDDVWR